MSENNKKLERWYMDTVIEDVTECRTVADMAVKAALEKFDIAVTTEQMLAIYCLTYNETIKKLMEKREDEPEKFIINIANVVKIGYDNVEYDEDAETSGNFNVFIENVGIKSTTSDDAPDDSVDACNQWMHANVKEQRKIIESIAAATIKSLHEEVEIEIGEPVIIFPLWCTIHEELVEFAKVKRSENNQYDYFMNFCNALEIHAQLQEDGTVQIVYKPNISEKLNIKSNILASSGDE